MDRPLGQVVVGTGVEGVGDFTLTGWDCCALTLGFSFAAFKFLIMIAGYLGKLRQLTLPADH